MTTPQLAAVGRGLCVPLDALRSHDVRRVGGKAIGLGTLRRLGLNVPFGVCMTAPAIRLLTGAGFATAGGALPRLRAEFEQLVAGAAHGLAIRPSVYVPSTARTSLPGALPTHLCTRTFEAALEAVQDVQDVAREVADVIQEGALRFAIIVQRVVAAQAAGVVFSRSMIGDGRITVESCHGLGPACVSGAYQTDHFALDRTTLDIVSSRIPYKDTMLMPASLSSSGVAEVPVPISKRSAPSIGPGVVREIGRVALRVERALGHAVDIEWAFVDPEIALLQVRTAR